MPTIAPVAANAISVEPFGVYALSRPRLALVKAMRRLRDVRKLRLLRSALRRAALLGRTGPVDCTDEAGMKLRLNIDDNLTDKRVFVFGRNFESVFFNAIESAMTTSDASRDFVYVDIGANTGVLAAIAASAARAHGRRLRCLAIEPQKELLQRLAANLNFADLAAPATIFNCAVGDRDATVALRIHRSNRGETQVTADASGDQTVPMTTLIAALDQAGFVRIDFMKLDVEGYEHNILQHFFSHADRSLRPLQIVSETRHDETGRLTGLLERFGYRIRLRDENDTLFELHED